MKKLILILIIIATSTSTSFAKDESVCKERVKSIIVSARNANKTEKTKNNIEEKVRVWLKTKSYCEVESLAFQELAKIRK